MNTDETRIFGLERGATLSSSFEFMVPMRGRKVMEATHEPVPVAAAREGAAYFDAPGPFPGCASSPSAGISKWVPAFESTLPDRPPWIRQFHEDIAALEDEAYPEPSRFAVLGGIVHSAGT